MAIASLGFASWSGSGVLVVQRNGQPDQIIATSIDGSGKEPAVLLQQLLRDLEIQSHPIRLFWADGDRDAVESGWMQNLVGIPRDWQANRQLKAILDVKFQDQAVELVNIDFAEAIATQLYRESHLMESTSIWIPSWSHKAPQTLWRANKGHLDCLWRWEATDNPDNWLEAILRFAGYDGMRGAYSFLSLASLGEPRFVEALRSFVEDWREDGRLNFDLEMLAPTQEDEPDWSYFRQLLGGEARQAEGPLSSRELDLAASVDKILKEFLGHLARGIQQVSGTNQIIVLGMSPYSRMAMRFWQENSMFSKVFLNEGEPLILAAKGAVRDAEEQIRPEESIGRSLSAHV